MIPILCMACNVHLFNTDTVRLHFPMSGEMFDPVVKGFSLRPGYLRLEIFCPVCSAFPFYHDGTKKGFRGVGRLVKTIGLDGKPAVMDVSELVAREWPEAKEALIKPVVEPEPEFVKAPVLGSADEFPCPECGAKKRFHRATCSKFKASPEQEAIEAKDGDVPDWLVQKVETVPSAVPPDAPPTSAELQELIKDREARSVRVKDETLLRLM